MANENMDEWRMRPGVINETVLAAKRFLEERPEELAKVLYQKRTGKELGVKAISRFLGWEESRVSAALSSLRDVESGVVDREAVEMMPLDFSFPGVQYFGKVIHGPI